jgi:hypothetical protein
MVCSGDDDLLLVFFGADMESLRQMDHAVAMVFVPLQVCAQGRCPRLQNRFQQFDTRLNCHVQSSGTAVPTQVVQALDAKNLPSPSPLQDQRKSMPELSF